MQDIVVIDYGMGNLRSVAKAVEHAADDKARVHVTDDAARIRRADRVVFPGQGAARDCMAAIDQHGVREATLEALQAKPFLGICMGLQVLMQHSAEQDTACLGVVTGRVERFPDDARDANTGVRVRVPQMGWNRVFPALPHPLFEGIAPGEHFYFANSYHVVPDDEAVVAARTPYAVEFVSAIASGNVFATQFHPEKSAAAGQRLLANFIAFEPDAA